MTYKTRDKKFFHLILLSTIFITLFVTAPSAFSGEVEKIEKALQWGLVPGAGHYYLEEDETAHIYTASFLALTGAGAWLYEKNRKLDRDDEINTFWLLALKEWELSLFTTYRSAIKIEGHDLRERGVDDMALKKLFLSPFQKENCADPMVATAAFLGIAAAAYESRHPEKDYHNISRIGILGADANKEWGSFLYGLDALTLSWAAAVGEETFWRGVLQNEMEITFGEKEGFIYGSLLFGAAHIVDLDGEVRAERILTATLAGFYLGHMYHKNGHRLEKPIAAHFWYNFMAMITSFALDPDNNPLGVAVKFDF